MVVLRVVRGMRRHFMVRLIEWALAINLAGFALILLDPDRTFASSHSYDVMARWASERTWGLGLGLIASVRLIALILNGTFPVFARYSPLARSVCAALGAVVWALLSISFLGANPSSTGWWNYAVWMAVDVTLAIHIAGPAGAAWTKTDGGA